MMTVQTIPPIEEMTPGQRVELMGQLWDVMIQNPAEIEPPQWHRQVLDERRRRVEAGETDYVDWEVAKRQIYERIGRGRPVSSEKG